MPSSLKLRGRTSKYIFKKAMEPLLPKEILYRRKQGFTAPLARWPGLRRPSSQARRRRCAVSGRVLTNYVFGSFSESFSRARSAWRR